MSGNSGNTRTQEQVDALVINAKLDSSDLLPATQILYINGENAMTDKYTLLELDSHLLETLKEGQIVSFKGSKDEDAVLCTNTKTYDVRECETSNSLLLIPNLLFNENLRKTNKILTIKNVLGINYKYLEVSPGKPRLNKILRDLELTKYSGPENEYKFNDSLLKSYDEILNMAQCSEKEFERFINEKDIVEINQCLRLLEPEYHFRLLSFMLKSIDEHSWEADEINKEETVLAWNELAPTEILNAVFDIYSTESKEKNGIRLYKYNELKIGIFFAKILLEYAGKFNLQDFLQAWKDSMPEGMSIDENMLNGIAIINRNSTPNVIWAFPENQLPDTIPERFQMLFDAKPKWTYLEINPYIMNLTTDKLDVKALLAKYARCSNENSIKYYSAKHNN